MLNISLPWWEFAIRAVVVYVFLLAALRLTGKRQIGQLAPFDLVLLLILSNAVQNSMNGGDNSLTGGLILASVLIALNWVVGYFIFKFKKVEEVIEGRPKVLVHDGAVFEDVLRKEQLTHHELEGAMRKAGGSSLLEIRFAVLESNGGISFIFYKKN